MVIKHFDLFSGYGGFTLAAQEKYEDNSECKHISEEPEQKECEQGGVRAAAEFNKVFRSSDGAASLCNRIETIGFSEIDKYASAVLKNRWPNIKNYGDITKINWAEVPDFDLLTGGSPCQDLSIAGKRAGLLGSRSSLFYEFMRAVQEKRPRYFIWENVKGALSSQGGWDFATVLNEMAEAGYSLWWQLLNAKDFGVPQNRERIFVVGFRDECPPEILFNPRDSRATNRKDKNISYAIDTRVGRGFAIRARTHIVTEVRENSN
jgi:DNA-cytosine methyltransferase